MSLNNQVLTALELAEYILAKKGRMSLSKLQKLLFYSQAWHMVFFEKPLIEEEFEAWLHGPVCPSVWNKLKKRTASNGEIAFDPEDKARVKKATEAKLTKEQQEVIADVLEEYGAKTAYHLECLTHAEKPWIEARGKTPAGEGSSQLISKESIKRYYGPLLSESYSSVRG